MKAQVSDVQMHAPLTGSQKGVEQFEGSRKRAGAEEVAWAGLGLEGLGCSSGQPYCVQNKRER